MEHKKLDVCYIKVSDLQKGMSILNVGIVRIADVYFNSVVVHIELSSLLGVDAVPYKLYEHVLVRADKDGKPLIIP